MKSLDSLVMGLYEGIFLDLLKMHPSIRLDLERDYARLREIAVSRSGDLRLFTLDLPDCDKWFLNCLSSGTITGDRPAYCGAKNRRDVRPEFLHGLYSLIFSDDGTLLSSRDVSAISSIRQIYLPLKKYRMDCDDKTVDNTVSDFVAIERSLPSSWPNTWDHDDPVWSSRHGHPIWGVRDAEECQLSMFDTSDPVLQLDREPDWDQFRNIVARLLHQFGSFDPFAVRGKHGPGAVADRESGFVKYDFRYWTRRLDDVFPYDWHASNDLSVPDYAVYREFPSKLLAVPKTQKGPRLIACEPTSHQWIQGGLMRWIEDRLQRTFFRNCVDFHDQSASQQAALEASLTGSHVTVDLSSASDRLSTRLVEFCFQSNRPLLDALQACRTRVVTLPDGAMLQLKKYSTQGNGTVFHIQTLVYAMIAIYSIVHARSLKVTTKTIEAASHEVRIFGDDIIVPTDAYPVLKSLLETCLLKVNTSKSFHCGEFRESCGMDAYAGVDVTPAYFRERYGPSPTSLESIIECSNNFFKKGFWHTADFLSRTVPTEVLKLIPIVDDPCSLNQKSGGDVGTFGLYSYCGKDLSHLKRRWNQHLHRHERRAIRVESRPEIVQGEGNGSLSQFLNEEPDPATPYRSGQVSKIRFRKKRVWVEE